MNANSFSEPPRWGFYSPEGFFQPLHTLTPRELAFVSKSVPELEAELRDNLALERYETCALIRDELLKRHRWSAGSGDRRAG